MWISSNNLSRGPIIIRTATWFWESRNINFLEFMPFWSSFQTFPSLNFISDSETLIGTWIYIMQHCRFISHEVNQIKVHPNLKGHFLGTSEKVLAVLRKELTLLIPKRLTNVLPNTGISDISIAEISKTD